MIYKNDPELNTPYVLTADIGGSHITAAVCDLKTNTIIDQSLIRTEVMSKGHASQIFSTWGQALSKSAQLSGVEISGLGLAMPGPFDYEKGISCIKGLNKYEALFGMDVRHKLAESLTLDPNRIKFLNDAEATIAGEAMSGAGSGYKNFVGVTLGTGFGSAHCLNGQTKDLNWGSLPFKDSIADDFLSTRWFQRRYHELTGISISGVRELAQQADQSQTSRQLFKEFAINMADFLSTLLADIEPETLILCGNITKASRLFLPELSKRINVPEIRLAGLGETAALIGAAGQFETVSLT
ncbi:ROK family protein [Mucilaginibacter terrae]|uniref:ROK family protein n=1 Tax=Mucilaginibacter terrae TaxID=1955052 RepID=UPI0036398EFA